MDNSNDYEVNSVFTPTGEIVQYRRATNASVHGAPVVLLGSDRYSVLACMCEKSIAAVNCSRLGERHVRDLQSNKVIDIAGYSVLGFSGVGVHQNLIQYLLRSSFSETRPSEMERTMRLWESPRCIMSRLRSFSNEHKDANGILPKGLAYLAAFGAVKSLEKYKMLPNGEFLPVLWGAVGKYSATIENILSNPDVSDYSENGRKSRELGVQDMGSEIVRDDVQKTVCAIFKDLAEQETKENEHKSLVFFGYELGYTPDGTAYTRFVPDLQSR